jgi:hypothetical protein
MTQNTRELFESLTNQQQLLLLEAIGNVPKWVVSGNAIKRTAAAPVVFARSYRSHRRNGMPIRDAIYWAWRWTQAFCL